LSCEKPTFTNKAINPNKAIFFMLFFLIVMYYFLSKQQRFSTTPDNIKYPVHLPLIVTFSPNFNDEAFSFSWSAKSQFFPKVFLSVSEEYMCVLIGLIVIFLQIYPFKVPIFLKK
jgi:hypothetical protein